ncbi:ABC transporter ATP-binding protein [Teichococcus aestuarii]|uniref:Fe3+/spermidine/putrescine ABC transporter ATP-binding protein n=1 Tax=Teichococcus aestuarii TaxID=568898 RepID=A0A2U1V3B6_9PROT|nr:ABC transporter ATP-binding protein [Pseudoroseomonas aestuarii]PWC28386.1 Fe3+/spermidine/putrescine ABC transporter ATP-binding protein [Pseudoroseomonas aestuarii]
MLDRTDTPAALAPAAPAGHRLDMDGIRVRYGQATAVDGVTLSVEPGEILALLGPSGCGKTTLLRTVAGFIRPEAGRVLVDGAPIGHLPPGKRGVGIVFQSYALFPHMSAAENVAYGLEARGRPKAEVIRRVEAALAAVRMEGFAARRPRALSGGQQQRVALARALAIEPAILLLDEPFAALDRALRLDLQLEIKRIQRRFGVTAVLVTHDQDEAMSMADRMAVMRGGRVEQVDAPATVYDSPATPFVAGFVGTSNRLHGRVEAREGADYRVRLDVGASVILASPRGFAVGERVLLCARPEHLALRDATAETPESWPARLRISLPLGPALVHDVEAGATELKLHEARHGQPPAPGPVRVALLPTARPALFPAGDDA